MGERDAAVARYLAGESAADVAVDFGISRGTVRRWVLEAGHDMRPRGAAPIKHGSGTCQVCGERFDYTYRNQRPTSCDRCAAGGQPDDTSRFPGRECPDCGRTYHRSLQATRCYACQRAHARRTQATNAAESRTVQGICVRCGVNFQYDKPAGYTGTRRLCDSCRRHEKDDWAARRKYNLRQAYGLKETACSHCGEVFMPSNRAHRFCSADCSRRARQRRRAAGTQPSLAEVSCAHCGAGFRQRNSRQRYCCAECRYADFKKGQYSRALYSFTYRGVTVELSGHRISQLRRDFGLEPEQYEQLWRAQRGKCAICRRALTVKPHPHVDHDPVGLHVRGLLCVGCNLAVGYLGDDAAVAERAATYLRGGKTGPGRATRSHRVGDTTAPRRSP